MLTRRLRLRLPQSSGWQCCCHRDTVAQFSTGRRLEDSSPSPSSPSSLPPSLYDKLFRGKPGSGIGKDQRSRSRRSPDRASEPNHRKTRRPSRHGRDAEIEGNAPLAGDELRVWLEKEAMAAFELESARAERYQDVKDDKKVLVMPHMSRSLAESDFYRYAPQGRHVAGWAGGIVKVVQSASPVTREPRGQYFIFFDSASAAAAYLKALDDLHQPKTGAYLDNMHEIQPAPPLPLDTPSPPKLLSDVELASFMGSGAPGKESGGSPPPRVRPLADSSIVPYALGAYITGRFQPKGFPVLVRLTGSKITVEAMAAAVEADGAARNLPWRLIESRPSVAHWPRQVQSLRAGSGKIALGVYEAYGREDRHEHNPQPMGYGYTRFIITFADAAEARRFARTWNRGEMVDDRTTRTMLVHTTALWS